MEKVHFGKADRALKILEYLKAHTDSRHRISQKDIRAVPGMEAYVGDKHFFHNLIIEMALSLNYDENGRKKPLEDCRILFDDFKKMPEDLSGFQGDISSLSVRTSHIYYNHCFSNEEVNFILEALNGMEYSMPGESEALAEKVKKALASSYYKEDKGSLPVIHEFDKFTQDRARKNMELIGQAIKDKVRIAFEPGYYNVYNCPVSRGEKVELSPYYLVSYQGRYYVWGAVGRSYKVHIYRIDLMINLQIPGRDENTKGIKAAPKSVLEKRYRVWSDKLMSKHPGMKEDYSTGNYIRVHCLKEKGEPRKRIDGDYTFLHDIVGNGYFFRGMDHGAIDYDVFHVDGDVMEVLRENKRIYDAVSPVMESELETVMSSTWAGWDDWYGYGGQGYSPLYGEKRSGVNKKY